MNAGIIIYNNSNAIQIDGEYRNLCLRSKVAVTCNVMVVNGATYYKSATQTFSGVTSPTIAVHSSSPCNVLWMTSTQFVIFSNVSGATATVYLFGDPSADSDSNVGLQIHNASNQLVYDAGQLCMRVVGLQVLANTTQDGTFTYATGRTYAAVLSGGFWGRTIATGAPSGSATYFTHEWKLTAAAFSSNVMTLSGVELYQQYTSNDPGILPYTAQSATYALALDVTNY